jgi:hypothetical protein
MKPKRTKAFCDCGQPAFKKTPSGPVCERCAEIEEKMSRDWVPVESEPIEPEAGDLV